MKIGISLIIFLGFINIGCHQTTEKTETPSSTNYQQPEKFIEKLNSSIKAIEPFFEPMGEPGPYDWLSFNEEAGQTFEQYINNNPTLPTKERQIIYIQPLGEFNQNQSKIIQATAEYTQIFYNLPIKLLDTKEIKPSFEEKQIRFNTTFKMKQVRTGYILEEILLPNLPDDAAALIAFTSDDLYPDETMNYVFGQASLQNRVGVWSLNRLDDHADYQTFLKRTLKISVHETGHMFSLHHCTKYSCVMSGTNHLDESDSRPIDACPECMAKICWMTGSEPQKRYQALAEFCLKIGLEADYRIFLEKEQAINGLN